MIFPLFCIIVNTNDEIYEMQEIKTIKQLKDYNSRFLNSLDDRRTDHHTILETYKYTMILPESYIVMSIQNGLNVDGLYVILTMICL